MKYVEYKCAYCQKDKKAREVDFKAAKRHFCSTKCLGLMKSKELLDPEITLKRFESKIYYGLDGCWYWIGKLNNKYGCFNLNGNKHTLAHRAAFEIYKKQSIPDGMFVCHSCDNPLCVNPDHLFLGTPKDNTHDMLSKGRDMRGAAKKGSKLTEDKVKFIRENKGNFTYRQLGKMFGIHSSHAHSVAQNLKWKWLQH